MTITSLRTRFSLAMLGWVIAGLFVVGLTASALFKAHVERIFHAELEEHLVELMGLTALDAKGQPHLVRPLSDPRFGAARSGYYWQVNQDEAPPLRSPSLGKSRLDEDFAHSEGISHIRAPGPAGPAMIYGMTRPATSKGGNPDTTLHYIVATDITNLEAIVADFRRDLLVWLAALAAALIVGAALALRFATRPLDALGAAVAAIHSGKAQRMGAPWPAEIAPLAADLDRLLDSREAMVAAARIESGNLAHGLRTSLAVLTDEAESLADQPAGATLLAECRRIARQLDWHLARASSAASEGPVRHTALRPALAPLITAMRRLHQGRRIAFSAEGPAVSAIIDPEAFTEILSNLLDNAGKWATQNVSVDWQVSGSSIVLRVVDDGPGISPEGLERLFKPGVRLDEQTPGHGLGLAIAQDLAKNAHATLALAARPDGECGILAIFTLRQAQPGQAGDGQPGSQATI